MFELKHTFDKSSDEKIYLNFDYDNHMGTKLDYLAFKSSQIRQILRIQLLKTQSQQEWIQILAILLLLLESRRVTSYLLAKNRSKFLKLTTF